jgi:agmatinase
MAGMDVVEVAPPYDQSEITAEVAHRVCLEVVSSLAVRRRDHGSAVDDSLPQRG